MDSITIPSFQSDGDREEWFLARLGDDPIPGDALLNFVTALRAQGRADLADSWAELLQDSLAEGGAPEPALRVLGARVSWGDATPDATARWKEAALNALEPSHERKSLVPHAGFDQGIAPVECVRRLQLLLRLKPGVLCLDKTWGFGLVRRVDTFYGRVEIDFEKKAQHTMSLVYAAEALQLLDEGHLLARLHRQPDEMRRLVQEDAAEVVRTALRSYGPLAVPQLQEKLVPRVVAEADWKRFWDAARRDLKKDPLVHLPARRTEPLRLLEREKSYDGEWFNALAAERDMETVLSRAEELAGAEAPLDEASRRVVGERLAFVIKGAGRPPSRGSGGTGGAPEMVARAVLAADALKVPVELVDVAARVEGFFHEALFLGVTRSLPARAVRPFVRLLAARDKARMADLLLKLLNRLNLVTLNEAIDFLVAGGDEARCAAVLQEAMRGQTAEVEVLYWVSRNPGRVEQWSLGTLPELAHLALIEIEKDYSGDRLKVQNMLRGRFEQNDWLKAVLSAMDERQRGETVQRIRGSSGWPALDRQSLLGQIVKLYPELQELLVSKSVESAAAARGPLTSERSYRERQQQIEKLTKVDIPQNSKEIAVARSYGDLSENYEFKAAKEMQGILLRRRGELEAMLHRVKPSDFKDLPHERAGIGTGVVLRYPDGRTERYCILGEWDQDAALGIISCETRMAKALEGRRVGERVVVPTESGEAECEVAEVTGLSEEVRKWIEGG